MSTTDLAKLKTILKEYKFKILLRQRFHKIRKSNLQFLAKEYELENVKGEIIYLSLFIYPQKTIFSFYDNEQILSIESLNLFLYYRKPLGEK